MKKQKVGIISAGKCCANCKYSYGNSECQLHKIFVYPGSYCESFEEEPKKVKRKISQTEYSNKSRTVDGYFYDENRGYSELPAIPLPRILQRLPKKTAERVEKLITDKGYNINWNAKCGYWRSYLYDDQGLQYEFSADYGDCGKLVKAYIEYLYEDISPLIDEDED